MAVSMKRAVALPQLAPRTSRRSLVCKSSENTNSSIPATTEFKVPEQLKPVVDFLGSENVKLEDVKGTITKNSIYTNYLKEYAESPVAADSLGWKKIPETINGRAAMLGFLAAASAEIFGAGPVLQQLATLPQSVIVTLALITAGSIVPVVKGTKGDYLASLQDTYTLPEGWFTEQNEKVNGRVAMLGLFSLIFIEVIIGRALL